MWKSSTTITYAACVIMEELVEELNSRKLGANQTRCLTSHGADYIIMVLVNRQITTRQPFVWSVVDSTPQIIFKMALIIDLCWRRLWRSAKQPALTLPILKHRETQMLTISIIYYLMVKFASFRTMQLWLII